MNMNVQDLVHLLSWAIANSPQSIIGGDVRDFLLDSKRANKKHNPQITMELHDDIVKALRGPKEKAAYRVMLVTIPADIAAQATSPIIRP